MTRNELFEKAVLDAVGSSRELTTRDILQRIKALVPEQCVGDWEHDVHNAQQSLKKRGVLTVRPVSGNIRRYYWMKAE